MILITQNHFSVVFKLSHPLWPVCGCGPAGFGPGAGDVETPAPLEGPELFESDLAGRPIAEDGVLESAVPVYTDALHFLGVHSAGDGGVAFGGRIGETRPCIDPPHAGKHGDIVGALDVGRAPVVRGGAASPHGSQSGRDVAHPAVRAVAAHVIIVGAIGACLPGVIVPVADGTGGRDRLGGLRAAADLLLDFVQFGHGAEPPAAAALAGRRAPVMATKPVAVVVIAVHLPDEAPLMQVRLAGDGPGLFPNAVQDRHEDRHQQRNDGDYHQKLYQRKSPLIAHDDAPFLFEGYSLSNLGSF